MIGYTTPAITLGPGGITTAPLGVGTWAWGEQRFWGYGQEYGRDEVAAAFAASVAAGVTLFDTAEIYGQGESERILGELVRESSGTPIIVATKFAPLPWRLRVRTVRQALDASLERLGRTSVELYQIHFPERPMPWGSNPTRFSKAAFEKPADETAIPEQLDALAEVVKAGKIRHIGLSNESGWGTMRFVIDAETRAKPRVQSIQNAYNLLNRTFETGLAEIALREDVGLLAYSPLAQGFLTGKYLDGAKPAGARTTLFDRGQRYQTAGAESAIKRYIALAKEAGLDPAQMALAFVNSRVFVTSNIIGATAMAQLKTDIASIGVALPADLEAKIDAIHQEVGNPCP